MSTKSRAHASDAADPTEGAAARACDPEGTYSLDGSELPVERATPIPDNSHGVREVLAAAGLSVEWLFDFPDEE